jgi:hypothetical protein
MLKGSHAAPFPILREGDTMPPDACKVFGALAVFLKTQLSFN